MGKKFEVWLILDYRKGTFRTRSTKKVFKSNQVKGTEIPIKVQLDIEVPEQPLFSANAKIELTPAQMSNIMISKLEEGNEDEFKEEK